MSEPIFDITFYGIIQPGMDKEVAINNMAQLFKTTPEKVAPFFAGGRKVIKSRVDEPTANKYRTALENAGLVIKLEAQSAADIDTSDISAAPVGADVLENPPTVEPQPIGDISNISMAEVGADVLEHPPEVEAQPISDISGITIAEVGADILENPEPEQKAPAPDTSDLSVKDER